jgi:hypothetical protein
LLAFKIVVCIWKLVDHKGHKRKYTMKFYHIHLGSHEHILLALRQSLHHLLKLRIRISLIKLLHTFIISKKAVSIIFLLLNYYLRYQRVLYTFLIEITLKRTLVFNMHSISVQNFMIWHVIQYSYIPKFNGLLITHIDFILLVTDPVFTEIDIINSWHDLFLTLI